MRAEDSPRSSSRTERGDVIERTRNKEIGFFRLNQKKLKKKLRIPFSECKKWVRFVPNSNRSGVNKTQSKLFIYKNIWIKTLDGG